MIPCVLGVVAVPVVAQRSPTHQNYDVHARVAQDTLDYRFLVAFGARLRPMQTGSEAGTLSQHAVR